jgi:hypothetical protein
MTLHTCRRPLPRWEMSIAGRLRWTLWPSPSVRQLGSQSLVLTGPLPGFHASLRPVCSLAPPSGVLSVSFTLARVTQAMRLRPLTASGLSPYGFMDSSRHHRRTNLEFPPRDVKRHLARPACVVAGTPAWHCVDHCKRPIVVVLSTCVPTGTLPSHLCVCCRPRVSAVGA